MSEWKDQRILITGVCGTVGRELLRQLVNEGPKRIVGVDNNESELFFLEQDYGSGGPVSLALGDVRDARRLLDLMTEIDVVLHAAAFKHVQLCERSPRDAIQTNVLGTQNVIEAAEARGVSRVVFTSSDKAVNPTSVMGTSKLMGERLITAADTRCRERGPMFASTRFGNVLGSRGSVIPLFRKQIRSGGPVTLTDPRMTRFIMTLEEAVSLTLRSVFLADGGEVFVTKMPVVRIEDLARVMVDELAPEYGHDPTEVSIEEIGVKPGEKMYEELLNEEEVRRTVELERYFVVRPAVSGRRGSVFYEGASGRPVTAPYNSSVVPAMSAEALACYLNEMGLLAKESPGPGVARFAGVVE